MFSIMSKLLLLGEICMFVFHKKERKKDKQVLKEIRLSK